MENGTNAASNATLLSCISSLEDQCITAKTLIESIFDRLDKIDKSDRKDDKIDKLDKIDDIKSLSVIKRLSLLNNNCILNNNKLDDMLRRIEYLIG